jgi:hypothetical protein
MISNTECPPADEVVWKRYAGQLRETHLPLMRGLFSALCAAVHERGLGWRAATDGETIGFKATGEPTFKVALHASREGNPDYRPPSLLIHPVATLADLGVEDPYPHCGRFWVAEYAAHGWWISPLHDVPDVTAAVDLAATHGRR